MSVQPFSDPGSGLFKVSSDPEREKAFNSGERSLAFRNALYRPMCLSTADQESLKTVGFKDLSEY